MLLVSAEGRKMACEERYIRVCEEEGDVPIEIPLESDGTLLLSTLSGMMPGASGLKYRNEKTGAFRGLRIEGGKIFASDMGWPEEMVFYAVFPKEKKRKMDDIVNSTAVSKLKKLEWRKCSDLVVLGIPYHLGEDELREYFKKFGEVVMSQVKRDMKTGKSKGYGFIRFLEYESQLNVISQKHQIDGRWCEVKIPNSRMDPMNPLLQKVFVGGLAESISASDLRDFFSSHGTVLDVFIPKPFRGFGFLTFADIDVAQSLCGKDFTINGVSVRCSHAVPRETAPQKNVYAELFRDCRLPSSSENIGRAKTPNGWSNQRSQTDVMHPSGNSIATSSSSLNATNQATVGMGALNLGSLFTPAVWAAAQAALLNQAFTTPANAAAAAAAQAAAPMPTADLGTLLGSLQTAAGQLSQCSVSAVSTPVSILPQNSTAGGSAWWPTVPNVAVTTVSTAAPSVCSEIRANGDASVVSSRGTRGKNWKADDEWRSIRPAAT